MDDIADKLGPQYHGCMKLIVGLGNPGKAYGQTRHNIGFDVLNLMASTVFANSSWQADRKRHGWCLRTDAALLLKPTTFMNRSGLAVADFMAYYHIDTQDLWVVHDDIDLTLGVLKVSRGERSAGHHGVQSIIDTLKTRDFVRFRLGIGRGGGQTPNRTKVIGHVLSRFDASEQEDVAALKRRACDAILCALDSGVDVAMNAYNTKLLEKEKA